MASFETSRINSLVETVADGIITIDERGLIESFNPAAERLFQYRADEVIGRNVSMLMPSPSAENHDEHISRYVGTGERRIIGIGREVVGRRKNGETFPMRISVGEFREGDQRMFTGIVHDLTEQKEAAERLLRSERLSAMGQMMSVITHESRNILQLVQLNLEFLADEIDHLRRQGISVTALSERIQAIQSAQDRLQRLYQDLRGYAAPLVIEPQPCHLGKLLEQSVREVSAANVPKRIHLRHESNGTSLQCLADPFRMDEVFRNLVENSVAACPDPVEIRIDWAEAQLHNRSALRITFRDNGPGIRPELRDKLFQPFFTTKSKGTGLGLAITKRIIESHGGQIAVHESGDPGAGFVITMPRGDVSQSA